MELNGSHHDQAKSARRRSAARGPYARADTWRVAYIYTQNQSRSGCVRGARASETPKSCIFHAPSQPETSKTIIFHRFCCFPQQPSRLGRAPAS